MIAIIMVLITCIGLLIYFIVSDNNKKRDEKYRFEAAARLIKEEMLNEMIAPPSLTPEMYNRRLLVELSWEDSEKQRYMVDPAKGIKFGRSSMTNDVIVDWPTISANHCVLFLQNSRLFVQDLSSGNGTFVMQRNKQVRARPTAEIRDGDCIIIGGIRFTVHTYFLNMSKI